MLTSSFLRTSPRQVLLWCLAIGFLPGLANAAEQTYLNFSLQGQVDQQVRATANFSRNMTALGQADAAAPFTIDCGSVRGAARWNDPKHWTYTLSRPLQAGERCDFQIKNNLKALDGAVVVGDTSPNFFAPGPWPRSISTGESSDATIEEDQVFIITPSAPLKTESLEKNLWCEADGVGQRIPVRLITEAQKKALIEAQRWSANPNNIALRCAENLPAGAKMRLVWGVGVETQSGVRGAKNFNYAYKVREVFRASFSCEREKANAPCTPLSDLWLKFSAPIDAALAAKIRLKTPDEQRAPSSQNEERRANTIDNIVFKAPFPQNAELTLSLPEGVEDQAGRTLANAASFPLKVRTGALPPLAKFPGDFGILELKEGGILPVTLRNVEALLPVSSLKLPSQNAHRFSNQRLTNDGEVIAAILALNKFEQQMNIVSTGQGEEAEERVDSFYAREFSFLKDKAGTSKTDLPRPSGSNAFEVIGIPLQKPGFHIVEIESQMLGAALLSSPEPMYVRTSALVTNMAVHFKRGKGNALVWVTALDSGQALANAEVRVSACDGQELWQGRTDAKGRALIEQTLTGKACDGTGFLFISARLGDDYSFARSDWNEGIEPWRFGVQTWAGNHAQQTFHSVLDRTLLRAGQTVSMKHLVRDKDNNSFTYPPAADLPNEMIIRHQGSDDEFRQPLSWDQRGSAISEWKIPETAKRGTYQIELHFAQRLQRQTIDAGEFRVGDFRLPVFSGHVQGVQARLVAPKEVPLTLGLSFLNGGAAKGAKVKVSATRRPIRSRFSAYEAFNFSLDFNQEAKNAFALGGANESEQLVADRVDVTLDNNGAGKLSLPINSAILTPSELYAEMSFADPNGEIQTLHGAVELWPAALRTGIRAHDWASANKKRKIEVQVLDTQGKPLAGVSARISAKQRIDFSHRKRIVGGFYAYQNSVEFKDLGEICQGQSDSRGKLFCTLATQSSGNVYLLAESRDKEGNLSYAGTSYWVNGNDDPWFTAGNDERIDVIPEKRSYAPGEIAKLHVRMPFRTATALVSVEADGIIESEVVTLSRANSNIEVPIKGEWGPNVFVSVLVVRGRIEALKWYSFFSWGWREPSAWFKEWWNPEQPSAMVDLAKPAFKFGLASLDVGVDAFRLKVEVTPDKADYRPRDTALVNIKVTQPDGKPAPAGSEVAFAAVDQALLELRANDSWNLLDAMLLRHAYLVETSTAQSQVIGKRHFGKKSLPPGGGGGRAPARELFDTLLTWNPRVLLDANGMATLKVPINDSLTEFKLVAIANSGTHLFGTGSASVRTKQDLQLISGLPPMVRETDQYRALLTLRNGTAKDMNVLLKAKAGEQVFADQEVLVPAEGASEVSFAAEVPEGKTALHWEFDAQEKSTNSANGAKDLLRITQEISPAVPVNIVHTTFAQLAAENKPAGDNAQSATLAIPVAAPSGALRDKSAEQRLKGGIEVALSAKLSTPPPSLQRFFANYPFICLEQKSSVAIGLRDPLRWQKIVADLPTYLDNNGFARYYPGEGFGYPILSAYFLSISAASADLDAGLGANAGGENRFLLPPELEKRMLKGLSDFVEGRVKSQAWAPQNDTQVVKLAALEALTRRGEKPLAAISSLDLDLFRLPTSALIDWYLVAKRLNALPERIERLKDVEREIRNRLSYAGGRLSFSNESNDYYWWLMVSSNVNAFRLIEAVIDDPAWANDLPALVQGAMLRQQRGHWQTTTANTWASIALEKFGRKFERDAVSGKSLAQLGQGEPQSRTWPAPSQNGQAPLTLLVPWSSSVPSSMLKQPQLKTTSETSSETLNIKHTGSGKPWAAVQLLAAVPVNENIAHGLRVTREVSPVQESSPGQVTRGDVWRVRLKVQSDQALSWVVLSDPIPAGARILGDGDGRDSKIAATGGGGGSGGDAWLAYIERTFSVFRAYYTQVPRGEFSISYTLRLNNAGEFVLPPTRVEAMYAPEIFGAAPNQKVVVHSEK